MTTTAANNDPYNWKSLNRKDLMSLSTIKNDDTGFAKARGSRPSSTLHTGDISGAQPFIPGYRYTSKESFINRNEDIVGSSPKRLNQPLDKPYYYMTNEDIGGSHPQQHKFVTTRSPSNPLEPVYRLPQSEIRVPTPPKFIRDAIRNDDIDGARPNPYVKYNIQRKTMYTDDIEGSHPSKPYMPKDKVERMNVRDINYAEEFRTKRVTNPLNPTYPHIVEKLDQSLERIEIGAIDRSSPKRLHPPFPTTTRTSAFYNDTKDINGAQASTRRVEFFRKDVRKDFRETTKTEDIDGTKPGSLKKGIQTNRKTNPLERHYIVPGHTEKDVGDKFAQQTRHTKSLATISGNQTTQNVSTAAPHVEANNKPADTSVRVPEITRPESSNKVADIMQAVVSNNNEPHNTMFAQTASRNLVSESGKRKSFHEEQKKPMTATASNGFVSNKAKFYDVNFDDVQNGGSKAEQKPKFATNQKYDIKTIHPLEIRKTQKLAPMNDYGGGENHGTSLSTAQKLDRFLAF